MTSLNQDPTPGPGTGYSNTRPYQPFVPYSPPTSPHNANAQPQTHRLSQNYQAYQAYQPTENKDHTQDRNQWPPNTQSQNSLQPQHELNPVQDHRSTSPSALNFEKRHSRIGWQNPYLMQSEPSSSGPPLNSQPYVAPSAAPPQVTPHSNWSTALPTDVNSHYFPPPPSLAPFQIPYQHVQPANPPPMQHAPTPQQTPVYELPGDPIPPSSEVPPAIQPLPMLEKPELQYYLPPPAVPVPQPPSPGPPYPPPLFSHAPSSESQSSIPHFPTPQSSAPQTPAPQIATPSTQSLTELRERLEAAGVPDETIATVLLQHTNLTANSSAIPSVSGQLPPPIPPKPTSPPIPLKSLSPSVSSKPLSPPVPPKPIQHGYQSYGSFEQPPQLPPRLPPRPSLSTSNSSSTSLPMSSILEKVSYRFYLAGTTKTAIPVFRHHIDLTNGDPSQRSYITSFTIGRLQDQEPHLRIYRKEANINTPPQIATCMYHRSEWSQKVAIKHIWRAEPATWEPELEPWSSATGIAAGQTLQWHYDAPRVDAEGPTAFIIRCASTIPKARKSSNDNSSTAYVQSGAQSMGTPVEVEVCRIVMRDGDDARIEIPRFVLSDDRATEQIEEMLCNALIQVFRKRAGWTTKRRMKTSNSALKLAGFSLKK